MGTILGECSSQKVEGCIMLPSQEKGSGFGVFFS